MISEFSNIVRFVLVIKCFSNKVRKPNCQSEIGDTNSLVRMSKLSFAIPYKYYFRAISSTVKLIPISCKYVIIYQRSIRKVPYRRYSISRNIVSR